MKKLTIILLAIAFSIPVMKGAWAQAESDAQGKGRPPRHGPPPAEAISVCAGQSEGATCSFVAPHGDKVNGVCENTPQGDYFACKPDRPPHRKGGSGQQRKDPPSPADTQ